ncbi:MAG TPA: hypothetical protein VF395_22150, partial [Polyangiaceae bacterium]
MKLASIAVALAAVAAVATLGGRNLRESLRDGRAARPRATGAPVALLAPCPPGALPDDGVCIPVPTMPERRAREAVQLIPRRPDRDADYGHYELPVPPSAGATVEANGTALGADGGAPSSGVVVRVKAGTAVTALGLEGQQGNARVVYASPPGEGSLVTVHVVREHDREKEYLVILSGVTRTSPLAARAEL